MIQAAGHDEIYLLLNGTKYHIHHPSWMGQNGYGDAKIHVLTEAEVQAIPTGYPLPEGAGVPGRPGAAAALEGRLLAGDDGRVYIVMRGERHWVLDGRWIAESRYAGQGPISLTDSQLAEVPLGGDLYYQTVGAKIALWLCAAAIFLFLQQKVGQASACQAVQWRGRPTLRSAFAAIFIAAIALREPYLLQHPRFWAEEGFVWFQYASSHSLVQSIFFVNPLSTYFNLAINVAAILSAIVAARFGLEYAPLVTTIYAFAIQALAIVLILFCKSRLFDSTWKAVAGCLIVLFAATSKDELWLNTTNSMSFLGLIALLLLFVEMEDWPAWARWGERVLLLICGLSSPYATPLLPLFAIAAWRSKEREQKIQCLILGVCLLVQVGSVVKTRRELVRHGRDTLRGMKVQWDASAINVFCEQMLLPAVGAATREGVLDKTGLKEAWTSAASFPPRPVTHAMRVGGCFCLMLIVGILALLRGPTLFSVANQLIGVFLILAPFTCLTALYAVPTNRYAFLPGFTFLLLLLLKAEDGQSRAARYGSMAVLAYGLAAGMVMYQTPKFQEGPSWQKEVNLWRENPAHPLRVWPPSTDPNGGFLYKPNTKR